MTLPVSAPVKVDAVIPVVALISAPTILLFAICLESIELLAIFALVTAFAPIDAVTTLPAVNALVAVTESFSPAGVAASKVSVPLLKV